MDLNEFIKDTLVQISRGIESANNDLGSERKKPDGSDLPKLFLLSPGQNKEQGEGVHFDVAVTSKSDKSGKGGAKFKLSVIEADIGGDIASSHQSVSRVSFSVNVNQWHG